MYQAATQSGVKRRSHTDIVVHPSQLGQPLERYDLGLVGWYGPHIQYQAICKESVDLCQSITQPISTQSRKFIYNSFSPGVELRLKVNPSNFIFPVFLLFVLTTKFSLRWSSKMT